MDEGVDDKGREPEAQAKPQVEPQGEPQVEPPVEVMKLDIAADVRAAAENKYERRPLVPQKEVTLSQADDVEFRAAQRLIVDPPATAPRQKMLLLAVSLVAFLLIGLASGSSRSLVELAMLVGVILFHELGHMAGMIVFGYKDVRIFFVPLLGGAAMGKKHGVAKWKEAIVLLLGPAPGLIAGVLLLKVFGATGLVHTLAMQLIVINALNLLPAHPLDGGRLFSVLLFSRNRHLELVFTGVTCALLGVAALFSGTWIFAIFVYIMLSNLPLTKRMMDAGHRLRDAHLPANPAQLSEQQQKRLWREMWDALPDGKRTRWRGQPFAQARAMEEVLERATMRPPSVEATIFILLVWLGGIAGAAVAAMPAKKPPPAWATYHFVSPAFAVDLQGTPRVEQGRGRTQITAGRCQITFATIAEDEATWIARTGTTAKRRAFAKGGVGFLVVGEPRCLDSFQLE
ncbi:MAG TPA: site-2 protease family protein [Kofleriaceae bacterium]|nr:site-2 protease family protein [Kofleriaceae bacterium]